MSKSNDKPISLEGMCTRESLPYPFVHYPGTYGAFIGFARTEGAKPYLCACSRRAFDAYLAVRKASVDPPSASPLRNSGILMFPEVLTEAAASKGYEVVEFVEGLCHRCNLTVPSVRWCHEMYGGVFKQTYGWYIAQAQYKFGLDTGVIPVEGLVVDDVATLAWRLEDLRARRHEIAHSGIARSGHVDLEQTRPLESEMGKLKRQILKIVENEVRTEFGMKKIGDRWVSETILAAIVKSILPAVEVRRHFRPPWLEGLELDIWIPSLRLGIEYQGIQHFKPIKAWGGKGALAAVRERDQRKRALCVELGVRLEEVTYKDPLTEEFVLQIVTRSGQE